MPLSSSGKVKVMFFSSQIAFYREKMFTIKPNCFLNGYSFVPLPLPRQPDHTDGALQLHHTLSPRNVAKRGKLQHATGYPCFLPTAQVLTGFSSTSPAPAAWCLAQQGRRTPPTDCPPSIPQLRVPGLAPRATTWHCLTAGRGCFPATQQRGEGWEGGGVPREDTNR